jgi:beta-galactosidase/beta-glucuronidase
MWNLSGIYRSVQLLAKPAARIVDMRITASLDERYHHGRLDLRVDVEGAQGCSIEVVLYDPKLKEESAVLREAFAIGTRQIDEKGSYSDRCSCFY